MGLAYILVIVINSMNPSLLRAFNQRMRKISSWAVHINPLMLARKFSLPKKATTMELFLRKIAMVTPSTTHKLLSTSLMISLPILVPNLPAKYPPQMSTINHVSAALQSCLFFSKILESTMYCRLINYLSQ